MPNRLTIYDTGEADDLMKLTKEQLVKIISDLSLQLEDAAVNMLRSSWRPPNEKASQ